MNSGQFDVKEKFEDDKYLSIHNGLGSAILNDGTLCWWSKLREMLVGSERRVKIPSRYCPFDLPSGPVCNPKGSHPERKVQFFLTLFKRPLSPPPPFRLNIMW